MATRKRKNKQDAPKPTGHESLYNKYRPRTIGDIHGNSTVIRPIKSMLENGVPHAILLSGEAGCGKTTTSRIIANELGCSSLDLKEIDITHYGGVDSIRQLRLSMGTKPMRGDVKVWILDEAHKLSADAKKALLKILEEPPEHCYFILCSTEPNSLSKPILSRCTNFTMKPLAKKQAAKFVTEIAEKEGIGLPPEVAEMIAEKSAGHPRAALVMLDTVINLPDDQMLSAINAHVSEESEAIELARALGRQDWGLVAKKLKEVKGEPESIRRMIRSYYRSVLLNAKKPNSYTDFSAAVLETFQAPIYNTDGFSELVTMCYSICVLGD